MRRRHFKLDAVKSAAVKLGQDRGSLVYLVDRLYALLAPTACLYHLMSIQR
jgi:hypothetical protein